MTYYEVIVGNIGRVYQGSSPTIAYRTFDSYRDKSRNGEGRAAEEPVTLFADGDLRLEYEGGAMGNEKEGA
jgi:hypothetical protein